MPPTNPNYCTEDSTRFCETVITLPAPVPHGHDAARSFEISLVCCYPLSLFLLHLVCNNTQSLHLLNALLCRPPPAHPFFICVPYRTSDLRFMSLGPRTYGFCWNSLPLRGTWPTKPRRATSRLLRFQPTSCRLPSAKPHSTAWRTRSVSRGEREIKPAFGGYNPLFHKTRTWCQRGVGLSWHAFSLFFLVCFCRRHRVETLCTLVVRTPTSGACSLLS